MVTESYQTSPPSGPAGSKVAAVLAAKAISDAQRHRHVHADAAHGAGRASADAKKGRQENSSTGSVSIHEAQRSSACDVGRDLARLGDVRGRTRTSSPASCKSPPPASATAAARCACRRGCGARAGRPRAGRRSRRVRSAPQPVAKAGRAAGDQTTRAVAVAPLTCTCARRARRRSACFDRERAAGAVHALDGEVRLPPAFAARQRAAEAPPSRRGSSSGDARGRERARAAGSTESGGHAASLSAAMPRAA